MAFGLMRFAAGLGGFRYPFYEVYVNCAVFSVKDGQFFGV